MGLPSWWGQFKSGLAQQLRIPLNPATSKFLDDWYMAESGGGGGRFNPFNTTRTAADLPGATNYNSAGVKNYTNLAEGIRATAGALTNGYYNNIVSALRSGRASENQLAGLVEASPWGTKHFPTLGGGPPVPAAPYGGSPAAPTTAPGSPLQGVDVQKQLLNMLMAQNNAFAQGKQLNPNSGLDMLKLMQNASKVSQLGVQVDPTVQAQGLHPNANSVVSLAKQYLGTKYVFGGNQPGGFDCSGLVQYVYGQRGIRLPRTTFDQWKVGTAIQQSQLQPGDILFFNTENDPRGPSHEGMYIGGGQFIQSPHTGSVVQISSLSDPYFQQTYVGARRVAG